jgi:hypothetical protein
MTRERFTQFVGRCWRIIKCSEECIMVERMECGAFMSGNRFNSRLYAAFIMNTETSTPDSAAALWIICLTGGLVRKFIRSLLRSSMSLTISSKASMAGLLFMIQQLVRHQVVHAKNTPIATCVLIFSR